MNVLIKKLSFLVVITATFFASCEKTSADFVFDERENYCVAPCDVSITNLSEDAESYAWNYGDGETSNTFNPKHTYENAGTYTVTLTAISESGNEYSTNKQIIINEIPQKILVTGATIYKAPLQDFQGNNWDDESEGNLPDIFAELNNGTSVIYATSEDQFVTDVGLTDFPLTFTFNNIAEISRANFGNRYYFDVEDKDDSVNKVIGYVSFTINQVVNSTIKYPFTIQLENDDIKADLFVSYE